jgi:hypothetical protein
MLGADPVNAAAQAAEQAMPETCNATTQALLAAACIGAQKCKPTPGGRRVIAPNVCALVTATRSCHRTAILSVGVFPLCRCPDKRSWILLPLKQARPQAP